MTSTSYIFMRLFCYVRKSRLTGVNDAKVRVLLAVKDFFSFLYNSNRSPINFDKHLMTWGGGEGEAGNLIQNESHYNIFFLFCLLNLCVYSVIFNHLNTML